MITLKTISRPYAKAIVSLARMHGDYDKWSAMLQFLSLLTMDPQASDLLHNLSVPHAIKAQFVSEVGDKILNEQAINLVKILAKNKRLLLLPEIYKVYEDLRQKDQKQLTLTLVTAEQVANTSIQELTSSFATHFSEQLILEQQLDPKLIAGGKLKIGDRVLNSSVQDRLKTLYNHLTR